MTLICQREIGVAPLPERNVKTLEVVLYDPEWPRQFSEEHARLSAALGDLACRIDHNGSTAVPGLAAKPIIDIQMSVNSLFPIENYRGPLQKLGYVHVPHADDARCPFFHRGAQWPHSHHVHVVESGGNEERRTLAFRDYLRDHTAAAAEYARLKLELAPAFSATDSGKREEYAQAKGAFIERIVTRAIAEGYPLP